MESAAIPIAIPTAFGICAALCFAVAILYILATSVVYSIFAHFLLREVVPYFAAHDMSADAKRGKSVIAILIMEAVAVVLGTVVCVINGPPGPRERDSRNLRSKALKIISACLSIAACGVVAIWLWGWHVYFQQQQDGLEMWATRCYQMAVFMIVQVALMAAYMYALVVHG